GLGSGAAGVAACARSRRIEETSGSVWAEAGMATSAPRRRRVRLRFNSLPHDGGPYVSRSRRLGLAPELGDDLLERPIQGDARLPADQAADPLDIRNAPAHVLEIRPVGALVGNELDRGIAPREPKNALGEIQDRDL